MTKLLIDADFIVYKCCASAETEIDWAEDVVLVTSRFSEAYKATLHEIMKVMGVFGAHAEPILFFSHFDNFRKKIYPEYKGHRNRKKPCGYKKVISMLHDDYQVVILPELEADDAMGIYATKYPGNVIVSPDKDMRQIPGPLYDFKEYTAARAGYTKVALPGSDIGVTMRIEAIQVAFKSSLCHE